MFIVGRDWGQKSKWIWLSAIWETRKCWRRKSTSYRNTKQTWQIIQSMVDWTYSQYKDKSLGFKKVQNTMRGHHHLYSPNYCLKWHRKSLRASKSTIQFFFTKNQSAPSLWLACISRGTKGRRGYTNGIQMTRVTQGTQGIQIQDTGRVLTYCNKFSPMTSRYLSTAMCQPL